MLFFGGKNFYDYLTAINFVAGGGGGKTMETERKGDKS